MINRNVKVLARQLSTSGARLLCTSNNRIGLRDVDVQCHASDGVPIYASPTCAGSCATGCNDLELRARHFVAQILVRRKLRRMHCRDSLSYPDHRATSSRVRQDELDRIVLAVQEQARWMSWDVEDLGS